MMKKTLSVLLLFITFVDAKICHQTLTFDALHHITSTLDGNKNEEDKVVKETLYANHLEENGTKYSIFWFGHEKTKKNEIDIESDNAPFLVRYSDVNGSYQIRELSTPSLDNRIKQLMWSKVSILQFAANNGIHHFKNDKGYMEVEQSFDKGIYTIHRLKSFRDAKQKKYLAFDDSIIKMRLLDKSCRIWKSLKLTESIESSNAQMKLTIRDEHQLNIVNSKTTLAKEHWFNHLSLDIKSWKFNKKINPMSLAEAQKNFQKKQNEMLQLTGDRVAFGEWVKENMDFLKHLSSLLENNTLDNEVSKKLFSKLGYLNSVDTTNILSEVTLNDNIIEIERFRGAMGLKNTSAPLDPEMLEELLGYGLSSDNSSDDLIKNMTGMISGALAKERMKRVPEQAERIVDAIIDTMQTKENKTVSLAAAGNLGELAPNNLVESLDNILMNIESSDMRAKSANALGKIQKSTLNTSDFQSLIENEQNTMTKTSLINASASSTNFKNNDEFNSVLVEIARNNLSYSKNKIAAINTLNKTNYATTKEEKKVIRKMMIGEKDSKILDALKTLYRR